VDVVMFGFNDWQQWEAGGFRTRCGAIARALAADPDVGRLLVVSTPHSLGMNAIRAARGRLGGPTDPRTQLRPFALRRVAPKVVTADHTRLLPREGSARASYLVNGALHDQGLRREILRSCGELGMRDWVLWVADPLMAKHIGRVGESLSVFDAIDDWTAHPEKRSMRACSERGYAIAQERADVIFTVSRSLRERLGASREAVYWQPNGVDASRFDGEFAMPIDLAGMRRPILGYVGVIQERLDVDLVSALARALPDASIVLVGPVGASRHVEALREIANVHLLGERHADDVPAYVAAFDVCLVPHVDDALTRSMDPLKVYEYLAAGKPVVASGLADMDVAPGLVLRCRDAEGFISGVRSFVSGGASGNDSVEVRARREFARSRCWRSRLDGMLEVIRGISAAQGSALT
jgi:teichuronic acid biosynthesis glycosyltransferase TuaH